MYLGEFGGALMGGKLPTNLPTQLLNVGTLAKTDMDTNGT